MRGTFVALVGYCIIDRNDCVVMAQIISRSCNWYFFPWFNLCKYDLLLLGRSIRWEMTEMIDVGYDPWSLEEKAWALSLIRNTGDTRVLNPFRDIDKNKLWVQYMTLKNWKKEKRKRKSGLWTQFQNCDKMTN